MSRKFVVAIAAVAALGMSTLIATDASARGFGGHGGGHGFRGGHGVHGGHGFGGGHFRFGARAFHRNFGSFHHNRGWAHNRWYWWGHRYRWSYPVAGDVAYSQVAPAVASPASQAATPASCSCLKKEYLQDGSMLFTDECTQEQALATPDQNQAAAPTPRATR